MLQPGRRWQISRSVLLLAVRPTPCAAASGQRLVDSRRGARLAQTCFYLACYEVLNVLSVNVDVSEEHSPSDDSTTACVESDTSAQRYAIYEKFQ